MEEDKIIATESGKAAKHASWAQSITVAATGTVASKAVREAEFYAI